MTNITFVGIFDVDLTGFFFYKEQKRLLQNKDEKKWKEKTFEYFVDLLKSDDPFLLIVTIIINN